MTGISNEKTNELTIYGILCLNITMQEILKACKSSKKNFSRNCFIADDSQNCMTTCSSFQRA